MQHSPQFLALVARAQKDVTEITLEQLAEMETNTKSTYVLIDVREDNEYAAGHLKSALHLGRGVIERDIELKYPDNSTWMVLYCGGGYRSILACQSIQLMGYHNVYSLIGGYKTGVDAGLSA